jgi:DNA-binding SARP family transcriptional activator
LRFSILGPLEISDDAGLSVAVTRPLHRSALALLLLNAGQPCSSSRLVAGLWGGEPPLSPDVSLRSCIYGIRKLLPDAGRLVTHPSGYLLAVAPGELDLDDFLDLVRRGRDALDGGNPRTATALLSQAVRLWREPPLADLPAVPARQGLLDQRKEARDALNDARLAVGEHRRVLAELRTVVAADPLHEHAWAQLITALYRSGARAEALAAFGRLRLTLISAHGIDPGPELQDLHRRILADDPTLTITTGPAPEISQPGRGPALTPGPPPGNGRILAPGAPPGNGRTPAPGPELALAPEPATGPAPVHALAPEPATGPAPVPAVARLAPIPRDLAAAWQPTCQLPMAVADFTGRAVELGSLLDRLSGAGMAVTVVTGMLGVGKTALAIQAAHLARACFPDGQLYACLDDGGRPRDPQVVLGELLRGLGVPAGSILATRFEREALYRSALAGRRVLVLVDGASSAAQVRPLLPGTAGSAVVVTSRARLPDLDGARFIELGGLERVDSVHLLGRISGRGEALTPAEVAAARSIASACGQLPLALRIAGARLADDPELAMADLASLLADERRRLDELEVGEVSMRSRLAAAAETVSGQARHGLALLAAADQRETSASAIAALLDDAGARNVAPELADAGLLHRVRINRQSSSRIYTMHPLVRAYAGELLTAAGPGLAGSAVGPPLASGSLTLAASYGPALPGPPLPAPAPASSRLITSRVGDRRTTSRNPARS